MIRYPIFENKNIAGKATLEKEGLYCRLNCFFAVNKAEHYRLICCGENKILDLGRGIPKEGGWEMNRFFPWRDLPDGDFKFILEASTPSMESARQRLVPGESVERISKLQTGKLYCCEDGYWVVDA